MRKNLVLLLISAALCTVVFEGAVRVFVKRSPVAYGTLLGRDLPPLRVIPPRLPAAEVATPTTNGDGDADDWADLQGVLREDPLLGYAPQERTTSPHRWWITNNVGARSAADTSPEPLAGQRRILVFGESFASGSRVRQAEAWTSVLAAGAADLEVVNLAVDGYGMGQSLLRFRQTTSGLDYDTAMLVFVPTSDLWRDVNTIRSLAKPSWNSYTVMPRFVERDGRLTLVASPYQVGSDVYADNALGLGEALRRHLRAYDRFYFRTRYESPPLIGDLVLYKIAATVSFTLQRSLLLHRMGAGHFDLDSEAMRVSRMIFAAMRDETGARGKRFVLVILPERSELRHIRRSAGSARNWRQMVAMLCADTPCIDLEPTLSSAPPEELDRGYDRSHYGPRTNRVIAAAVQAGLRRLGPLSASRP